MIDRNHALPVTRQAELMQRMGIEALYRKPNTSKKHPAHKGLSVPAARAQDRSRQPGLGHGHHVRPDGLWLGLSVRDRRLGQPASPVAPGIDQHRDAAGDQSGSMSGEHELPTASVVRSSQATPARRPGQLCTDVRSAGLHLSKPVRCSDNRSHLCISSTRYATRSSFSCWPCSSRTWCIHRYGGGAGAAPARRSLSLPRNVVLQLLDDELLLGDDVLHKVADRDEADQLAAVHDRQVAQPVLGH